MKSLRLSIVALTIALILMLCSACGEELPPFIELSSVETPVPVVSTEKINRYNAEYTDSFSPSSQYGELAVFVGDVLSYYLEDGEQIIKKAVFGLCTTSGAVVVDPIYDGVITHNLNGIRVFELLLGSDNRELAETRLLIPSDGRWCIEIPVEQRVSNVSGDGLFAIERDRTIRRNGKKVTITYYDFYTFDGVFAFTFDKKLTETANTTFTLGNYSNGLMSVNVIITTESAGKDEEGNNIIVKTEEKYAYYVDKSGKTAFKNMEFLKSEPFSDGLAVVVSKEGTYGILKSDGNFFIEPQYNVINRNSAEGYFSCGTDGYFSIIKNSGDEITKIFCENVDIKIIGTDNLIYKKTLKYSGKTEFFSLFPDGAFTCKETGQFPDPNSGSNGIFTCSYSGVTDVFDKDGRSFAQFTDFGKICGVWGDCVVVEGKNGDVWTVNKNSGEKSDRIGGKFTGFANERYVVVKNNDLYSVYDYIEKVFIETDADFVTQSNGILSVVSGGYTTIYNNEFGILMRYCCETEVPR